MKLKRSTVGHLSMAALVVLSAAICATAAAQTNAVKRNIRERAEQQQSAPPATKADKDKPSANGVKDKNETKDKAATPDKSETTDKSETKDKSEAGGGRFVYEFRQPEFVVHDIRIEHDGHGRGHITFERRGDGEPIVEPFELSPTALERIAVAWDALRFLESDASYQSVKQFPHLGTMRLGMSQGARQRTAEFNWSDDPHASVLANEYRRAADQSIFVFEINLARDLQPLEAPKLLNRLESLINRNALSDPQQLITLLRNISTDERFPLIARNQAGRILKKLEK